MSLSTKSVRISDFDGKNNGEGRLTIRHFTLSQRTLRAAKFFGIFFGLALFSVLIPVLHFVLVPGFCFAAVGTGTAMFLQKNEIDTALGTCPYCGKETKLARAKIDGDFRDSCEHCLQLIVGKS